MFFGFKPLIFNGIKKAATEKFSPQPLFSRLIFETCQPKNCTAHDFLRPKHSPRF